MKKLLSLACALTLALGLLVVPAAAEEAVVTMTADGWYETICAELTGVSDADVTAVTYTGEDGEAVALTGDDFTYLVRDMDGGGVRIDIPGVAAGTYKLAVELADGRRFVAKDITVSAYDRSGFAHKVHTRDEAFNITGIQDYEEGVGAYKDDGTLKENALVLYVTEENKETISVTASNGTVITGIGNILNAAGTYKNAKFFLNCNRPLVVRIIGDVTAPEGVTLKKSSSLGGGKTDNGGMCIMSRAGNMTIEGIGNDATVNGWGFCFDADGMGRRSRGVKPWPGHGENFEVRNISFKNVPEDCIGIQGSQKTDNTTFAAEFNDSAEHIWVHNNEFYMPTIANPAESDKANGDGAVDFRNGEYMTMSYNHFHGYKKTSLIGSANDNVQYHITWHHNWWQNCNSRGPLGRQANMHIYNNVYENQGSYCMNTRADCYIFSEYNTFLNCASPMRVTTNEVVVSDSGVKTYGDKVWNGGPIKSVGDVMTGCTGDKQGTEVSKKTPVTSDNLYSAFDTSATLSYIPDGDYALQTDAAAAAETVRQWAGVQDITLSVAGANVVKQGSLAGESGTLAWSYDKETGNVTVTGNPGNDDLVLVAAYDGDKCVGVKTLTAGQAAQLGADVEKGKLFWLGGNWAPLCPADGWDASV